MSAGPRRLSRARSEAIAGMLMVAPVLVWLAATILYPLGAAVAISLRDIRVIGSDGGFVGFGNYQEVLEMARLWAALGRSLVWVAGNAVLQTLLALGTALLLNQRFRGVRLVRVWVILSWIVPTIVVVIIWRWLLGTSGGVVNHLLVSLGLTDRPIGFFAGPGSAMASLVVINSWRWFPFVAVMLLAGLQRIPADLYEAAAIDGAGPWQRFRRITWPLLQPTMLVLGVVGTLLSFNVFDIIWLTTAGGPSGATQTLPVLIYETAFKSYRLGQAAAMSVLVSLLLMALAVLLTRALAPKGEG
ncbi:carbohydrate ABC transporter permease [Inquilinus sp. Marseille-Q2685]|uniref:carbohydrate ABC transporter permease n=1 Tax=Inquilinus sp. Marseille-Q2685 TaxID=2866581 RepID=UPI001CE48106|nr:sugar ABC transporter permease [Inquilinus sp. Marseille-Q2685]